MTNLNFCHILGSEAISLITGLTGIIVSRSQNLHGCNRYYLQPKAQKDGKVPDGWWIDEKDVKIIGPGLSAPDRLSAEAPPEPQPGGPMSNIR
jgi:hypothetical protein